MLLFKYSFLNMSNNNHGKIEELRSSLFLLHWSISLLFRYEPYEFNTDKIFISHINTAVFLQSTFQYIWESIVFSRGAPYRRSIFSNCLFIFNEIRSSPLIERFSFQGFFFSLSSSPLHSVWFYSSFLLNPCINFSR